MAAPNSRLPSYGELAAVLGNLPLILRETRRQRGLSLRAAARELGMSFSTVTRFENGEDIVLSNAMGILRWADSPAAAPSQQEGEDG